MPVNIQKQISVQDLVEAGAKDVVLSAYLAKNQTMKLFGIQHKTELCKLDINYKMKDKQHIQWHKKFYLVYPKKVGYHKSCQGASEKDRWMNQTRPLEVVYSICNAQKLAAAHLSTCINDVPDLSFH